MTSVKSETLRGVKWSAIGKFSNTLVTFILGVILARLLSPSDYGIVGMTAIFFSVANVFIDGGFGAALIRKKDLTAEDCSTVFYFNIAASVLFYGLLFFLSPLIADFLRIPILKNIIRVSGLTIVMGSIGSIHFALLTKNVNFKTPALLNISLSLINAALGIFLAYSGFGVWSLVWPNVVTSFLRTSSIWFISPWRPLMVFSRKSFREMFGFGSNLVVNSILDKIYIEGTQMIIGRFYTPQALGFYTKGMNNAKLPSTFLFDVVGSVTYPVLSKIQDDDESLVRVYSKYIRTMSMVVFFGLLLLAALARPYVLILYSAKWEPAIIFLQLFCIRYLLYHIHAVNWNLLLVKGRSDLALKKEIFNKIVRFSLLIAAIPFGVIYICLAQILSSISDLFVNTYYAGKVSDMGFRKQCSDFFPYLLLAAIACIPSYYFTSLDINLFLMTISGVCCSSILYFGFLWWRKDESLIELIAISPMKKWIK